MTSNEFRQIIGMKPSSDPKADQLVNSNIAQPTDQQVPAGAAAPPSSESDVSVADMPVSDILDGGDT